MKRYLQITGCLLTLVSMAACEHLQHDNNQPSVHNHGDDSSEIVLSSKEMMVTDSSVDIFDGDQESISLISGVHDQSIVASGDSSVTIFSLDGKPLPSRSDSNFSNSYISAIPGSDMQIFFKHGSSRLGSGDKRKLSGFAEKAKFAPVNRITVSGYASLPTQAGNNSVEAHVINLKQSMNRAFAVSRHLMYDGVPAEKIKTVSWGATKLTGNDQQDRRVDVLMGEQ